MNDSNVNVILATWYTDGFATWSYRGANDGVDGAFGGSFHSISDIKLLEDGGLQVNVDFGSADKVSAMAELNRRLEVLNLKAVADGEIITIK